MRSFFRNALTGIFLLRSAILAARFPEFGFKFLNFVKFSFRREVLPAFGGISKAFLLFFRGRTPDRLFGEFDLGHFISDPDNLNVWLAKALSVDLPANRDFPGLAERAPLPSFWPRRQVRRSWRSRFCQICRTRSSQNRRQFCTAKRPSRARGHVRRHREVAPEAGGVQLFLDGRRSRISLSTKTLGKKPNFLSWTRGVAESGVPNTHFTVQTRGRAFAAFERARLFSIASSRVLLQVV